MAKSSPGEFAYPLRAKIYPTTGSTRTLCESSSLHSGTPGHSDLCPSPPTTQATIRHRGFFISPPPKDFRRCSVNKILFVLYLLASLLFIACGESHLAEAQEPLRSFAVIVPEKYAGNIDNYPIQSQIYIEQNQTLKFYLATIKDGIQNFGEDAYPYFKNVLWDIDGDNSNLPTIKHSFKRTGLVTGSLRLVDLWDDTTTHQFEFLVNTPQTISIDFPYDGYNQVNPLNNQSLPLRWSITGIDPWEQASCEIFASREKKEVWNSPIAKVDCFDKVTLRGSLVGIDLAETYDSSFSFYWAVKSTVSSLYASPVNDSTNIARFSTKILDTLSQIQISFRYLHYHASEIPKTKISVIAFNGDTLSTQYSFKKQDSYFLFLLFYFL